MYVKRQGKYAPIYFLDGKMVAKKTIPEDILKELENDKPVKVCLFCGRPSKYERFVNLTTVYLCENDYYDKTVGQIVFKLKEDNGQSIKNVESSQSKSGQGSQDSDESSDDERHQDVAQGENAPSVRENDDENA